MQITGAPRITQLTLSRRGDWLLVNCSDRVARMVEIATPATADRPAPFPAAAAASHIRPQRVRFALILHPGTTEAATFCRYQLHASPVTER